MIVFESFFKDVGLLFISRWKTITWASVMLGVALTVYGLNYFVRDAVANPIWMVWWALCGSYSAAFSEIAFLHYASQKRERFEKSLETHSGMTWVIYTADGVKIGEIEEHDYLKAKHEAGLFWSTRLLQGLNLFWVAWCIISRLIVAMPSIIVIFFIAFALTTPQEELSIITIGQIMGSLANAWGVIVNLLVVTLVFLLMGYAVMGKAAPGYKNYYSLRLKRLLSRHVPNIANADGYSISGYKIVDSPNSVNT
jgi:hypothetical protein